MKIDKLDDWLVDGWRQSWRWFSMWAHWLPTAVLFVVQNLPILPAPVVALIPQPWGNIITAVWAVAATLGRLVKQKGAADAAAK